MANFLKPAGVGNQGYDSRLNKQKISIGFGSHGCVRLTKEDAQQLFDWTPRHTLVEVR